MPSIVYWAWFLAWLKEKLISIRSKKKKKIVFKKCDFCFSPCRWETSWNRGHLSAVPCSCGKGSGGVSSTSQILFFHPYLPQIVSQLWLQSLNYPRTAVMRTFASCSQVCCGHRRLLSLNKLGPKSLCVCDQSMFVTANEARHQSQGDNRSRAQEHDLMRACSREPHNSGVFVCDAPNLCLALWQRQSVSGVSGAV